MNKDEALKLALEVLKQIDEAMPFPVAKLAQAAIKEALAQPEQEPVAWLNKERNTIIWDKIYPDMYPLYTTPPQRTWVGLTDEEISELIRATHNTGSFVRAIAAKLKEKNTFFLK
jgi:hypothetical protein